MQRRDSQGETTKIRRLSTGSTRRFRSRRSQSSISSITDVFACEAATEGHSDLSVSRMKLRIEKNRDGDEERDADARAANVTPNDPFEERGRGADTCEINPTRPPPSRGPGRA